jgi:uncharacterized protein with PQ loop repeat
MFAQLLGTAATAYGVLAGLTALLQARQMLARRTSCEVSARFLASYAGGYAIWLTYGFSTGSLPLIVVDIVGLCGGLTLTVALSLRGSLIRPATWNSCEATSISQRPAAPDERPHTHAASPSHDLPSVAGAVVHRHDARSERLKTMGAEIVVGLLHMPHLYRSAARLKVTGGRPVNSALRPDLYRRTLSHGKEPR